MSFFLEFSCLIDTKLISGGNDNQDLFTNLMNIESTKASRPEMSIKSDNPLNFSPLNNHEPNNIPPNEYSVKYVLLRNFLEKQFFFNWNFDNDKIFSITNIIAFAKKNKIPIILWQPRVSPYMKELYKMYPIASTFDKEIKNVVLKSGVPFINFNIPKNLKCDCFTDVSHLSPRCYTEILSKLIEQLLH